MAIRTLVGDTWQSTKDASHTDKPRSIDRPSSTLETPSRFNRRMQFRHEKSLAKSQTRGMKFAAQSKGGTLCSNFPMPVQRSQQAIPLTRPLSAITDCNSAHICIALNHYPMGVYKTMTAVRKITKHYKRYNIATSSS